MGANLDLAAVGRSTAPYDVQWSSKQAMLYALGVGAGQADPLAELHLTTDNTAGVQQQVVQTFAVVLGQTGVGARLPFGTYDRGALVHASQALTVHEPLAASGRACAQARIDGIYDKGRGALVTMSVRASHPADGRPLWTSELGYYVRGAGGFGGDRGPGGDAAGSEGAPDFEFQTSTRQDQALLYRLSGDLNPLHSDPAFAARAGFARPILHGLCTYGVVARELARRLCDGDQTRARSVAVRFSKPVFPGDELTVHVWHVAATDGLGAVGFRSVGPDGESVLDRGLFTFASAATTRAQLEPQRSED